MSETSSAHQVASHSHPPARPLAAVTGWGAVSPAGWGASCLKDAALAGTPLPVEEERRTPEAPLRWLRKVPPLSPPPAWLKQPRMRRTTIAARHAVAAALEALGEERTQAVQTGTLRVGVVYCTMNGCIQFSQRFYTEVLEQPGLASPILFPETVYNAPASHVSSLLGSTDLNYTLVGDSSQFISGIELALQWLQDGLVQGCLVIAAEERDWLAEEALLLYGKKLISAEGAAAVYLELPDHATSAAIQVKHIAPAWTYGSKTTRRQAVKHVWQELYPHAVSGTVLCESTGQNTRFDKEERETWVDWTGARNSVRAVFGEPFSAASGWQTVLACELLSSGQYDTALIPATGLFQQATGLVLGSGSR